MANDSLTADQLAALQEAAGCFVTQNDYGAVQLEAVMDKVFGAYATRQDNPIACLWSDYWKTLDVFAELSDAEKQLNGMPPMPSAPLTAVFDGTINAASPGSSTVPVDTQKTLMLKLSFKRKNEYDDISEQPETKRKPGKRPDELLDRVSICHVNQAKKRSWECKGCGLIRQGGRVANDVREHAGRCSKLHKLDPDACDSLSRLQAEKSLGAVLGVASTGSTDAKRPVGRPKKIEGPEAGQQALDTTPFQAAGKKKAADAKQKFQDKADHLLMLLICKRGLVPDLLDSDDWRAFVHHLNSAYKPTGSKTFLHQYIPQEAQLVKKLTYAELKQSRNLTYTFDGTSVRRGDSFYTGHACTPQRKIYFLGGHFGSKDSHDADWIKKAALEHMTAASTDLWAATTSDSTNVTLAARRRITEEAPSVLDLCDVVHFLQHLIGDINELPEFSSMFSDLKPLIRHFSKSGISKAHLRDSGELAEDGRKDPVQMLAKIGKTRFATQYTSIITVEPVLPNIQSLCIEGKIKFKSTRLQDMFSESLSLDLLKFRRDLMTYITLVTSIARALWSLEATTANPSDAFVFWLAIGNVLQSIFDKDEKATGVSPKLAAHVRAVFNTRYDQFFNHSDVYFVAFCLDQRYPNTEYLRKRTTAPTEPVGSNMAFPHAFVRVKHFIKNMVISLISQHKQHTAECYCHPILTTRTEAQLSSELKAQLEAFWLNEAPFDMPVLNDDIMEWWQTLERSNSPRSAVLAVEFNSLFRKLYGTHFQMLAVRIFGILVNSMPDERTNSNVTWFNSPLRGNQKAEGLVDMIMIGQWYRYHANGAEGPRRAPRRPTIGFRRLDKTVIERAKMQLKEQADDSDEADTDTSSGTDDEDPATDEELEKELETVSAKLRQKIAALRRRHKKKKGTKKVFRSDEILLVDVDVKLEARGLRALLSEEEDQAGKGEVQPAATVENNQAEIVKPVRWNW